MFLVLVILVRFIGQIGKNNWSILLKEFFCFLLGILPVIGTLLYQATVHSAVAGVGLSLFLLCQGAGTVRGRRSAGKIES
jgi:hypothetical protein